MLFGVCSLSPTSPHSPYRLPALVGALLSEGTDGVFVRREGVAVTTFRELRLADTVLIVSRNISLEAQLVNQISLQILSPSQNESGSSARGLQSHFAGRHLHMMHLEREIFLSNMKISTNQ